MTKVKLNDIYFVINNVNVTVKVYCTIKSRYIIYSIYSIIVYTIQLYQSLLLSMANWNHDSYEYH